MNAPITKSNHNFVHECLKRMHAVYLKYHLLYDKEVDAHEATKRELKALKKELGLIVQDELSIKE